ncbi:MAG TPA: DUF2283 domain-containing protein [Microvirga sp.]|jgi:uncharacterized protein YuzE|nr:DUF2283 domain-containing protein [Microvirga sp.]
MVSITTDPEADAAYLGLLDEPAARSQEVGEGIVVDYAADGRPVGVEVLHLRRRVGTGDPHSYLRGLLEGLLTPGREAAE